jgi:imidazoleglycerol phosphate synthase glutamine amidotransferase subunit HisH
MILRKFYNGKPIICISGGMCMDEHWSFEEKDVEFLKDVGVKEMSIVAREWAPKMGWDILKAENNARAWLHRIRMRIRRCQNYINKMYAQQRGSPRIRKMTTSGALPESLDEMESY